MLITEMSLNQQKKSLFIMDLPFQTFMYKAIYENLPFLMFINRDWHKWFAPNYSAFLDFLNKEKVLYYWDEEDTFIKYIKKIKQTGKMNRIKNENLVKYLEGDLN